MKRTLTALVLGVSLLVSSGGVGYAQKMSAELDKKITIVALGTSFTNGHGVKRDEAFPARLEEKLRASGMNVEVMNMGVDGNTTIQLFSRIKSIPKDANIVIYEFGRGNDARKNISEEKSFANSDKNIRELISRNHRVLLIVRAKNKKALTELIDQYGELGNLPKVQLMAVYLT